LATAVLLVVLWHRDRNPMPLLVGVAAAGTALVVAECFQSLFVQDEGDCLTLRFGPIPLFRKRLPYSEMTAVEACRSTILDGWGVHYTPGRGWIYNLWGFDCVKVQMGKKAVRIGTDDVGGLLAFLKAKIESPKP